MALKRPSEDFSQKVNIIASVERKQEATAEDFKEASLLFNDYADAIEALQNINTPNPYYGVFSSLPLLQAAHSTAEVNAFAIIDSSFGTAPQIALWDEDSGLWKISGATTDKVYIDTYNDRPSTGTENTWYITKDNYKIYLYVDGEYKEASPTEDSVIQGFVIINGAFVRKGPGNNNQSSLQVNDEVYFKRITNEGDPVTLIGHTYLGGNEQLRSSYEQQQILDS